MTSILKITRMENAYRQRYPFWDNFVYHYRRTPDRDINEELAKFRARFVHITDDWHLEFESEQDMMLFLLRFS